MQLAAGSVDGLEAPSVVHYEGMQCVYWETVNSLHSASAPSANKDANV